MSQFLPNLVCLGVGGDRVQRLIRYAVTYIVYIYIYYMQKYKAIKFSIRLDLVFN